jgi:hypothetical protein
LGYQHSSAMALAFPFNGLLCDRSDGVQLGLRAHEWKGKNGFNVVSEVAV